MRRISNLFKGFIMLFAVTLLITLTISANAEEADKTQDPDYYKYLKRVEEYQKEQAKTSFSSIATYAADPSASGKGTMRYGVDVSQWNSMNGAPIDINGWKKMKSEGYEFVFIRVAYRAYGDGKIYEDPRGIENLQNAKAAGLEVGAYIYSQAITETEAREEATYASNVVKASGVKLDLPLVLDFEYDPYLQGRLYLKHLTKTATTAICKAFVAKAKALGYEPMVYANRSMFTDQMYASQFENETQIWLAEFGVAAPLYKGAYDIWQYTDKGRIAGFNGTNEVFDLNIQYIPRIERSSSATTSPVDSGSSGDNPEKTVTVGGVSFTYTPVTAKTGKVIAAYVNLRKGPGTSFAKLGTAEKGKTFTINGICNDIYGEVWYRIKINLNGVDKIAYIHSDYICFKSEIPKAPTLNKAIQTSTSIKLTWSSVAGAEQYKVYRKNMSTGKITCVATLDSSVTTYKNTGLIKYKAYQYYVRAIKYKYGNMISGYKSNLRIGYTGGIRGYVNKATGLPVRTGPSATNTKLCTLKNNERVIIVSTSGSWYYVYHDHNSNTEAGYVAKKYIRFP